MVALVPNGSERAVNGRGCGKRGKNGQCGKSCKGPHKGKSKGRSAPRPRGKNKRTRTDKSQATTDLGTFELLTAWPLELGVPSLRKDRTLGTRLSATANRAEDKCRTGCSG